MTGTVIAQDGAGGWLRFSDPCRILEAWQVADVRPVLSAASEAVGQGLCVAGFISYEAAPGLDGALLTHPPDRDVPLVWMGVYRERFPLVPPAGSPDATGSAVPANWQADTTEGEYADAIRKIRAWIHDGDTYQVNYTLRLRTAFHDDALALFWRLVRAQRSRNAVYADTGVLAVCSASPELFFERADGRIGSRPMKGTAPRGMTASEDRRLAAALRKSAKNRAENVMITDMIRNDLGRIARPGSVRAHRLFEIERYPTVFQMVSTVEARSDSGMLPAFRALFPCASVTGAPKVRTMQIIRELERSPRGVYTGACGYWLPDGRARFNVAIRTVVVNRRTASAEYGTGGGIVWDSVGEDEHRECLTKAAILTRSPSGPFRILESLRFEPPAGWLLLAAHVRRAARSAAYFGFPFDAEAMRNALSECVGAYPSSRGTALKVRWQLDEKGRMKTSAEMLPPNPDSWRVGVARDACRSDDVFLYHKTTSRRVYEKALARFPGFRDVILVNERGEVTESCFGNVVIEQDGRLLTPPVSCGLLDGVYRHEWLRRGRLRECVLTPDQLWRADRVWLINSVRRWIPVTLCTLDGAYMSG